MRRRDFVKLGAAALAAGACAWQSGNHREAVVSGPLQPTDAATFRAGRRYADLSFGKIA